jgi:hypothetical protein
LKSNKFFTNFLKSNTKIIGNSNDVLCVPFDGLEVAKKRMRRVRELTQIRKKIKRKDEEK